MTDRESQPDEFRRQFFAEVRNDPYANMIFHHVTEAWASGYEQALRDNDLVGHNSHGVYVAWAAEWLAEASNKAAEMVIALAQVGKLLKEPRGL